MLFAKFTESSASIYDFLTVFFFMKSTIQYKTHIFFLAILWRNLRVFRDLLRESHFWRNSCVHHLLPNLSIFCNFLKKLPVFYDFLNSYFFNLLLNLHTSFDFLLIFAYFLLSIDKICVFLVIIWWNLQSFRAPLSKLACF